MFRINVFFVFVAMTTGSCNDESHSSGRNTIYEDADIKASYDSFKTEVNKRRVALSASSQAKKAGYLYSLLSSEIPAFWIGTVWDFNGTTRTPRKGMIACGYFVTNTLTDLGFDIPRVKLAQLASSKMIQAFCVDIKTVSGLEQFKDYMKSQPEGSVYIVGLDFHTGYIIKTKDDCYFLHANYIEKQGVVMESITTSTAFANSKTYVIGSLTANKKLLNSWTSH